MCRGGVRFAGMWVATAMLIGASRVEARTIEDTSLGFTLKMSDAYAESALYKLTSPNVVEAFTFGDRSSTPWVFMIENMGGRIRKNESMKGRMPAGFQGRILNFTWQGYQIEGFEIPETVDGVAMITYNVQVPLKKSAIQLKLWGPASDQQALRDEMTNLVAGLRGESNWSEMFGSDPRKFGRGLGRFACFGVFVLGVGYVVLKVIRR